MDVASIRRYYAEIVVKTRGAARERLVAAFAAVPREHYVGTGPWQVLVSEGRYVTTPSADLVFLYQDQLVALVQEHGINNGSPSSHALWLEAVAPRLGEDVIHVGAGTGYYTAVLGELVGPSGTVLAYEIAADLAERAEANLRHLPHVRVLAESGMAATLPGCDVLYVNAAVTDLPDSWLDSLRPGGRLLAPLTPIDGFGGMLLVTRRDGAASLDARFVSGAKFIGCVGGTVDGDSARLAAAFGSGGHNRIKALHRGVPPDSTCWYATARWWLSMAPQN